MENIAAILKTINDKIADQEGIIKMYRKETAEKDATIREIQQKVAQLEGENKGLADSLERSVNLNGELGNTNEALRDEIVTLRKVIISLEAEINNLANF